MESFFILYGLAYIICIRCKSKVIILVFKFLLNSWSTLLILINLFNRLNKKKKLKCILYMLFKHLSLIRICNMLFKKNIWLKRNKGPYVLLGIKIT